MSSAVNLISTAKPPPPKTRTSPAMIAYRLLTGKDNSSFCHKVSAAIAAGWQLHGSPTMTFNAATGEIACGQAVIKEVPDQTYTPDVKLGTL